MHLEIHERYVLEMVTHDCGNLKQSYQENTSTARNEMIQIGKVEKEVERRNYRFVAIRSVSMSSQLIQKIIVIKTLRNLLKNI